MKQPAPPPPGLSRRKLQEFESELRAQRPTRHVQCRKRCRRLAGHRAQAPTRAVRRRLFLGAGDNLRDPLITDLCAARRSARRSSARQTANAACRPWWHRAPPLQLNTVNTVVRAAHIPSMRIGLQQFRSAAIDWLIGAAEEEGRTRHALARELCERENWRNPRGVVSLAQASKALRRLAARLNPSLPAARPMPPPAIPRSTRHSATAHRLTKCRKACVACAALSTPGRSPIAA